MKASLSHEALVASARHRAHLMLGALHRDAMHVRTPHGFGDRRRIGRVVLLALDERLHIDGRGQPDIVAAALRDTAPVVAGRRDFHRSDAWFLPVQHLHQLRAGQRPIEENRPTPISTWKLRLARSIVRICRSDIRSSF